MKKKTIQIIAIILTIAIIGGVIALFVIYNKKPKSIYSSVATFIDNDEKQTLNYNINIAENTYKTQISASENRLTTLNSIISKLDEFEYDLCTYLVCSSSSSKQLIQDYNNLIYKRSCLINDLKDYIVRMNGNIEADGNEVQNLYNHVFELTIDYINDYNNCFIQTINHIFNKVVSPYNIKNEMYSLYSNAVDDLLNNVTNHQFNTTFTINILNNISLQNSNIALNNGLCGGEFNDIVIKFRNAYSNCNITNLLLNFEEYYTTSTDETTETNIDKLTVFYLKQML